MSTKRGRKFQGPKIINIKSKLMELGLDIRYVRRIEDIILYLTYYLGVMSLEQLCYLFDVLDTSIKSSIARILKNGDLIEIRKDEANNIYYLPTKNTISELKKICDVKKGNRNYKNIKHLSKTNDFFVNIFKSNCDKVKIEYEKNISNEDIVVRADAVINVVKDGNEFEFILEQDNNTEKVKRLYEKIANYYNIILHTKLNSNKIRYYIFRSDVLHDLRFSSKYNEYLINAQGYEYFKSFIDELRNSYIKVKNGKYTKEEHEKSGLEEINVRYSSDFDTFLLELQSLKIKLAKQLDRFKKDKRLEFNGYLLKNRIKKVKKLMLDEFNVNYFYEDSKDTIYNHITHTTRYRAIDSMIEGKDLLLMSNIIFCDAKLDYTLTNVLFNKENLLEDFIKFKYVSYFNPDDIHIRQVYKVIGKKTLCLSNFISAKINKTNRYANFTLFMPEISVSDYVKVEHILDLDLSELEESFENYTIFYIITTDDKTYDNYLERVKKVKSNKIQFIPCLMGWPELNTLKEYWKIVFN